jgi:ppGpp synthetase/RelA/SpoT-type nucleotidyltranferase
MEKIVCEKSLYTLTVNYRVKEPASVREKMIKNSYYRIFSSKEESVYNIQDIIGLRIECKFVDDEKYVYDLISSLFDQTEDHIYYYSGENPSLRLKLSEKQPQKQKNGFDIYKIDGRLEDGDVRLNFELQIKSLVNIFWGEIEHKIVYKNNSYVVMDDLVQDNMVSIKENLNLIDRQLHQLYRRYKRDDNAHMRHRIRSIDSVLSKMIHDTIANKMTSSIGFVTDFKKSCDSILQYILIENNAGDISDYGRVMLDIFYITNNLAGEEILFDRHIRIDRDLLEANDVFCATVLGTILRLINVDFQWHLFFLIVFKMDGGKIEDDLNHFVRYYKSRFRANTSFDLLQSNLPAETAKKIKKDLVEEIAYIFKRKASINLLWKTGMAALNSALSRTIEEIVLAENLDWKRDRRKYLRKMNEFMKI